MKIFNLMLSVLAAASVSTVAADGILYAGEELSHVVSDFNKQVENDIIYTPGYTAEDGTFVEGKYEIAESSPLLDMIQEAKEIAEADLMAFEFCFIDNVVDMTDRMADDMILELNTAWDEQFGTNFVQTEKRDYTYRNALNKVKSKGIMTENQLNLSAIKSIIQNDIGVSDDETQTSAGEKIKNWFSGITDGATDSMAEDLGSIIS